MKLCKDCKHCQPLYDGAKGMAYCTHPRASFNVVDGSPLTYCFQARGVIAWTEKTICGMDAQLFEQRPVTAAGTYQPKPRKPWWKRIFGG